MLFALAQPAAFAGLLVAFLLGLLVRASAIRIALRRAGSGGPRLRPSLRADVDPFGAVAAAVGGAGWGKTVDVDEVPRYRGRGRAALVLCAGPLAALVLSQLLLLAFRLLYRDSYALALYRPSDVLRGQFAQPIGAQFLLAAAVGLLAFGLLALIPIPPLDGFGLLWLAFTRPGPGMQWYRLWFEVKNVGVVVLLACSFFPLGYPLLLVPLDLIGTLVLRAWS